MVDSMLPCGVVTQIYNVQSGKVNPLCEGLNMLKDSQNFVLSINFIKKIHNEISDHMKKDTWMK